MRITNEQIAFATKLTTDATPGPWSVSAAGHMSGSTSYSVTGPVPGPYGDDFDREEDAAFVAASRALVPAILDEVAKLRAALHQACSLATTHRAEDREEILSLDKFSQGVP